MTAAATSSADVGVGFKPEHVAEIMATPQPLRFFEVRAEDYMGEDGAPHAQLSALRESYEISLHGVGLSIGGEGPLDRAHLARLRRLCDRYHPRAFSEHLAWSSHDGVHLNDLLPLPYTEQMLARVARHIDQVQAALGRKILIENPSTCVTFAESTVPEGAFITELCRRTGCALLLDVANVFVSAINHGGEPLPIDTHDSPVPDAVWSLYREALAVTGAVATLIEWDNDVPAWPVLLAEAQAAALCLAASASRRAA